MIHNMHYIEISRIYVYNIPILKYIDELNDWIIVTTKKTIRQLKSFEVGAAFETRVASLHERLVKDRIPG